MSWTDVYPVLTDELVELYKAGVTPEEESFLQGCFAITKTIQPQAGDHLVVTSLFWKHLVEEQGTLPPVSRETMMQADELGLVSRYSPWEHYVVPLLEGAARLKKLRPNVVFRVYLAADLEFLTPDLTEAGCEIKLMESSSILHNPGAMWRFLALEEEGRWVTVTDSDRAREVIHDVERTEHAMTAGLGAWRAPYVFDRARHEFDVGYYRPLNACQFGVRGGHRVEELMKALIWHGNRGTMPTICTMPGSRQQHDVAGTKWPDYGYDEWFLLAALYPRLAFEGFLTFVSGETSRLTCWHGLDFEYVTWANPGSELFICPDPQSTDEAAGPKPWDPWEDDVSLAVRSDSAVIRRERPRIGPAHRILTEPLAPAILGFHKFQGDLPALLEWVKSEVKESRWIDLNPRIRLSQRGGELFTSRSHTQADVVVCGSFFVKSTGAISRWALTQGLDMNQWQEGKLLRLPKLEGPLTLWKTDFSRRFHEELTRHIEFVRPEILMRVWIDDGRALMKETSAGSMGWSVR